VRFQGHVREFAILPRDRILADHRALIDDVVGRLEIADERRRAHVMECLGFLARLVNSLPAGEQHHDSDSCGLFRHALETAQHGIQAFNERIDCKALADDDERREAAERKRLGVFLACLIHDLGKLYIMRIGIGKQRMLVGATYLEDFAAKRGADRFTVQFRAIRTSNSWHDHEPLGLLLLPQICPPGLLVHISVANCNHLIWALSKNLGHLRPEQPNTTKSLIRLAMKLGDQRATLAANKRASAPQPDERSLAEPRFGRRVVEDFFAAFRRAWQEGDIACNGPDSHVLVGPSHSVLLVDKNRHRGSLLEALFRRVLDGARQAGAGPSYLELYRGGSPEVFLRELAIRYAHSRDRQPQIIPQNPLAADQHMEIRHFVVYGPAAGKPREGWGIIVHNDLLWGALPYRDRNGLFDGVISFRGSDRRSQSVEADEVGFVPRSLADDDEAIFQLRTATLSGEGGARASRHFVNGDATIKPRLQHFTVDHLDAAPADGETLPSRVASTVRIWQQLNEQHPIPQDDDPICDHWRVIDRTVNAHRLGEHHVDLVLYHIAARLCPDRVAWSSGKRAVDLGPSTLASSPYDGSVSTSSLIEIGSGRWSALDQDRLPSEDEVAMGILSAVEHIESEPTVETPDEHSDHLLINSRENVGLPWPHGMAALMSEDAHQRRLLVAAADHLLAGLLARLGGHLQPNVNGKVVHLVRLPKMRYRRHLPYHRILVLGKRQLTNTTMHDTRQRLPVLRSEWVTMPTQGT
jgi:hypothetical protein